MDCNFSLPLTQNPNISMLLSSLNQEITPMRSHQTSITGHSPESTASASFNFGGAHKFNSSYIIAFLALVNWPARTSTPLRCWSSVFLNSKIVPFSVPAKSRRWWEEEIMRGRGGEWARITSTHSDTPQGQLHFLKQFNLALYLTCILGAPLSWDPATVSESDTGVC